jgi:hypothetical protein
MKCLRTYRPLKEDKNECIRCDYQENQHKKMEAHAGGKGED